MENKAALVVEGKRVFRQKMKEARESEQARKALLQLLAGLPGTEGVLLQALYVEPRQKQAAGRAPVAAAGNAADNTVQTAADAVQDPALLAQAWIDLALLERSGEGGFWGRASLCRLWTRYLRREVRRGAFSAQEADRFCRLKTGLTLRHADRQARLLRLVPEWQAKLRAGQISLASAYELTFLPGAWQVLVWAEAEAAGVVPSAAQGKKLRALQENGLLNTERIRRVL